MVTVLTSLEWTNSQLPLLTHHPPFLRGASPTLFLPVSNQAGSLFPQFSLGATAPSSTHTQRDQDMIMRRHCPLKVSPGCRVDMVIITSLKRTFSNFSEAAVCPAKCWETSWEDEQKSVHSRQDINNRSQRQLYPRPVWGTREFIVVTYRSVGDPKAAGCVKSHPRICSAHERCIL